MKYYDPVHDTPTSHAHAFSSTEVSQSSHRHDRLHSEQEERERATTDGLTRSDVGVESGRRTATPSLISGSRSHGSRATANATERSPDVGASMQPQKADAMRDSRPHAHHAASSNAPCSTNSAQLNQVRRMSAYIGCDGIPEALNASGSALVAPSETTSVISQVPTHERSTGAASGSANLAPPHCRPSRRPSIMSTTQQSPSTSTSRVPTPLLPSVSSIVASLKQGYQAYFEPTGSSYIHHPLPATAPATHPTDARLLHLQQQQQGRTSDSFAHSPAPPPNAHLRSIAADRRRSSPCTSLGALTAFSHPPRQPPRSSATASPELVSRPLIAFSSRTERAPPPTPPAAVVVDLTSSPPPADARLWASTSSKIHPAAPAAAHPPPPSAPQEQSSIVKRNVEAGMPKKREQEEAADAVGVKVKKKRIQQACKLCGVKRVKCDGGNPCSTCVRSGETCEYGQPKKR